MIKAVIVDDEAHCVDRIKDLVTTVSENIQVVAVFNEVTEAINGILQYQPDLLFLDVQIFDQTGFDILKAIPNPNFEVIFTTAYEIYAVQAFKFSAVDYLLKPIDADDFNSAIEKVNSKLKAKDFSTKVEVLLSNISKQDQHKKISVPTSEGFHFIELSDIIRFEAAINYTTIFMIGHPKIVVSKTLKTFEEMLADCNFFRIHNSHLINIAFVKKYTKGKGGYVTMIDDSTIDVSTRRKEQFLRAMLQ